MTEPLTPRDHHDLAWDKGFAAVSCIHGPKREGCTGCAHDAALRTPTPTEPGLREALESVIRLIEPIPLSIDVEQAGMQSEVAIATARAALAPTPDTLDVERLAWAMHLVEQHGARGARGATPCYHDRSTSAWPNGPAIVAEYARLREDRS